MATYATDAPTPQKRIAPLPGQPQPYPVGAVPPGAAPPLPPPAPPQTAAYTGGMANQTAGPLYGQPGSTMASTMGPGTGVMPIPLPPPTMAPAPADPNAPVTSFGPGNDLRSSQINPVTDPRTQATQGQVDTAAGRVSTGPDLRQAGSDIYQSLLDQALPSFQAAGRGILQNAAAGGRLGSGMTEEELTTDPFGSSGLGLQLGKYRAQLAQQLAGTLAPAEAQNRLANLGALSGLESQQFGQGAEQRGELRGERGYQTDTANTALQNRINQQVLQDQLLNSAFGRASGAADLGLTGAEQYGQEGVANQEAAAGSLSGLGMQDFYNQLYGANRNPTGTAAPQGYEWLGGKLVPKRKLD